MKLAVPNLGAAVRFCVVCTSVLLLSAAIVAFFAGRRSFHGISWPYDRNDPGRSLPGSNSKFMWSKRGHVILDRSGVTFGWCNMPVDPASPTKMKFWSYTPLEYALHDDFHIKVAHKRGTITRRFLGFEFGHAEFTIPFWSLMILFSFPLLPSVVRLHRRQRRIAKGLCLGCGYDLRASTGQCPECGKAFEN
jgi:hypothetical protein